LQVAEESSMLQLQAFPERHLNSEQYVEEMVRKHILFDEKSEGRRTQPDPINLCAISISFFTPQGALETCNGAEQMLMGRGLTLASEILAAMPTGIIWLIVDICRSQSKILQEEEEERKEEMKCVSLTRPAWEHPTIRGGDGIGPGGEPTQPEKHCQAMGSKYITRVHGVCSITFEPRIANIHRTSSFLFSS
jgi:hypothetical protein